MNIDIVYLSSYGKFEGRFVPEEHKNSLLRIAQYDSFKDDDFLLNISKSLYSEAL
jgi:CRISPR-associated protein Cas1